MPRKPLLWLAFVLCLALTAFGAVGLLLPEYTTPGYLAGMAGLVVVGMAGASVAKLALWATNP